MRKTVNELNKDPSFIDRKTLLSRENWSKAAISKFRLQEVKSKATRRNKTVARYYHLGQVIKVEKSDEFNKFIDELQQRKNFLKNLLENKNQLFDFIDSIKINVKKVNNVRKLAVDAYNRRYMKEKSDYIMLCHDSPFIDRLTVNYIRHNLTSYNENLLELLRKDKSRYAYKLFLKRLYGRIKQVYPDYSLDCDNQFYQKFPEERPIKN